MRTPEDEICFTYANRRWVAREWSSAEDGAFFWKIAPQDQRKVPNYAEYREAVAHFEAGNIAA